MKSFLMLLASFIALSAQTQPYIGLKAGVVVSNVKAQYANSYENYGHKAKTGALFGLLVNWPISKNLFFRPGLELVIKGSKERHRSSNFFGGADYDYTINRPLTYIDIPLNLIYGIKSRKGMILLGGGPVAGFNLNRYESTMYYVKRFDPGINFQVAYEWPIGFSVNLNHERSLQNISKNKEYFNHFKNYYYSLSLSYVF